MQTRSFSKVVSDVMGGFMTYLLIMLTKITCMQSVLFDQIGTIP